MQSGLLHLTRLYLSALDLPDPSGWDSDLPDLMSDDATWRHVHTHAGRLPINCYAVVLDPLSEENNEQGIASLADDIADIHRDVVVGLKYHAAGRLQEAVWEWKHSLYSHWGTHATIAMNVMHLWLSANSSAS